MTADESPSEANDAKVQLTEIEYNASLAQYLMSTIGVFRDSLAVALLRKRYEDAAFYTYLPPGFRFDEQEAADHRFFESSVGLSSSEPRSRLAYLLSKSLRLVKDAVLFIATTDHEGDYFLQSYGVPFVLIDRPMLAATSGPRPAYLMFHEQNADVRSIRRALQEGAVFPSFAVLSVTGSGGSPIEEGSVITEVEAQALAAHSRQVVVDIFDDESRLICDFGGDLARL